MRFLLFLVVFQIVGWAKAHAWDRTIHVCSEIWPPYYVNEAENGQAQGITVDIATEITQRLGLGLNFEIVPYERCVDGAKKGKYAAAMGVDQLDGDQLIYGQNEAIYWVLSAYVRNNDSLKRFNSLEDFRARTWAKVDIYAYPEEVEAFEGWKILNFRDQTDTNEDDGRGFKILQSGRADVYLEDYFWAENTLKQGDFAVRALLPPVAFVPMFSGFYKGRKELARAWDEQLGRMLGDGSVDRIYEKWSGQTLQEYFTMFQVELPTYTTTPKTD